MAIGSRIIKNHIRGFQKEIHSARKLGTDGFFNWFNAANDTESSFISGSWDFACQTVYPVTEMISTPENKTALEIGYGGGRLLASASRYFNKVIGVDVHKENKFVADELKERNITNVKLLATDGKSIPVPGKSIDFVYSTIVFQHLEKIEILKKNLLEVYRILKKEGIAVIYVGRFTWLSSNRSSRLLVLLDMLVENIILPWGYKEIDAKVNEVNLIVTLNYITDLAQNYGFKVINHTISRKQLPSVNPKFGGQYGIILKKNNE